VSCIDSRCCGFSFQHSFFGDELTIRQTDWRLYVRPELNWDTAVQYPADVLLLGYIIICYRPTQFAML